SPSPTYIPTLSLHDALPIVISNPASEFTRSTAFCPIAPDAPAIKTFFMLYSHKFKGKFLAVNDLVGNDKAVSNSRFSSSFNGRIGKRQLPTLKPCAFKTALTGDGDGNINKAAIRGVNHRCNLPAV